MPENLKVYNDPVRSAEMVVEHFAERFLVNLGLYIGAPLTPAMATRVETFERIARDRGMTVARYAPPSEEPKLPGTPPPSTFAGIDRLGAWLQRRQRPMGLWTITDPCGWQALQACERAGLSVPDEVAVVSYRNDENVCDFCQPPLSSLATDQHRMGYEGAALLERLMRGDPPPDRPIRIAPLGVVARLSSDTAALDDPLVAHAVRFIRDHAGEGIAVQDVLRHTPASASTLLRRFVRCLGRTPSEEIRGSRLKLAARLVETTDSPLAEVADATGYVHLSQFCRDFKAVYHMTPTAYRNRLRDP